MTKLNRQHLWFIGLYLAAMAVMAAAASLLKLVMAQL